MRSEPSPIEYERPAHFVPERSIYRQGSLIVAPILCRLPEGCVKCGDPEVKTLTKSLSWHHPAWFLLVLFPGLLFYVIAALLVRKTGTVTFGLCGWHARRRRLAICISLGVCLVCIALAVGSFLAAEARFVDRDLGQMVGIFSLLGVLAGLIAVVHFTPILRPKFIDKFKMRLAGAGERYLADLSRDVPIASPVDPF